MQQHFLQELASELHVDGMTAEEVANLLELHEEGSPCWHLYLYDVCCPLELLFCVVLLAFIGASSAGSSAGGALPKASAKAKAKAKAKGKVHNRKRPRSPSPAGGFLN